MKTRASITSRRVGTWCLTLASICWLGSSPAALSDDDFWHVPYQSLGLSDEQAGKIDELETNWKHRYEALSPQLRSLRQELIRLLSDPRSDPLEVTVVQQKIARLKSQLENEAMLNYLGKRDVLDANQKKKLAGMLQRRLAERRNISG